MNAFSAWIVRMTTMILLAGFPPAGAADDKPTAREIMVNAHAAAGGDNWRKAKTLRLSGDATLYRESQATKADRYEMYRVYPRQLTGAHTTTGKFRLDAFSGEQLLFRISNDGERMYDQNGPMTAQASRELAASSFGFSATRFALSNGFSLQRLPDDQVEGYECYFLSVKDPDGGKTLVGVDRTNSLIRYVGWTTPRGWHHRLYSDFYWLDDPGFMQPGRVRHFYDGVKTADIYWRSARVNIDLDSSLFSAGGADIESDREEIRMRGIGWHVLRSHDPGKLAQFYLALGFREWASSERIIGLHAGGGAAIEIGHLDEASAESPHMTTRTQSSAAVIFGTSDAARVAENARAAGAMFVETWTSGDTTLYYIGDPEGNVIGFAEDGPMWGNTEELRRLGIEPKNTE